MRKLEWVKSVKAVWKELQKPELQNEKCINRDIQANTHVNMLLLATIII